jgi:phosphoserine phosphatase
MMRLYSSTPNNAATRVILVRHGRSTYNDQGRYQGSSDESILTVKGRQGAFQTGLALKEMACCALYTSPLNRAQQTAQEILAAFKVSRRPLMPIHVHPDLKEIDLPQWAGLPYKQVRETLADDYRCWIEQPHTFQMLPAEAEGGTLPQHPVQNLYAQAHRFWQQILPEHGGQTILVVSHGGTIRALLGTALGIPSSQFHTLQQSNCGITALKFVPQRPARLEIMNDTSHLGEVLPKLKAGRQGLRLLLMPDTPIPNLLSLQEMFATLKIDFSVSNGESAQATAQAMLTQSSQTVQLQTRQTDIAQLWLRTLNHLQLSDQAQGKMTTGLVVAKPALLRKMLGHVVKTNALVGDVLSLAPGRISIIHYAQTQTLPILQAMNFADFAPSVSRSLLFAS